MAVYTQVTSDQLEKLLDNYDIGQVTSFKGLVEGVENTNYFLATEKGEYILTLYEQRVNPEDLPFFMQLLEHLGTKNTPCPPPILNTDGHALEHVAGRSAAIFPFLAGISTSSPDTAHCYQVGRALAQLHLDGEDFAGPMRQNAMSQDSWKSLYAQCQDEAEGISEGLNTDIERVLSEVATHWPSAIPRGICHADLFTDNVLFIGKKISGIIDFYFACEEFFIYDLAVTINAWSMSPFGSFYYSNSHAIIKGYQEIRLVSPKEREVFMLMLRASALRFLLTRLYDWINTPKDAVVRRKDPMEYVRTLRFHLKQTSPSFYGFE